MKQPKSLLEKDTKTRNKNQKDTFGDCRVMLMIIPHGSDKRFPIAAMLRVETDNEVYQVSDRLDYRYREGDTGFRPHHLSSLFRKMADELSVAEMSIGNKE